MERISINTVVQTTTFYFKVPKDGYVISERCSFFTLLDNLETGAVCLVVDLHYHIFDDWSRDPFLQTVERTYDSSKSLEV